MTEETIFACAVEKGTPAERIVYLDEVCGGDAALRERVEALLESHFDSGGFLATPAIEIAAEEVLGQRCSEDTQGKPPGDDDDATSLAFLVPSEKSGSLGRLGHYDVSEIIGRGGMGVVLRAVDEKLQRVVAIKVMAPVLAASANVRQRFVREAQAAAAVRNDHVVNVYAVEEVKGLPYLVMECISGVSLQERLDRDGRLDVKEILRIGMQTAAGLAAAHAQGLIHRDIKPANILLENGVERVKITDFGLARAVDDDRFTQTGIVAGTPQYMAPEQARGDAVDHRADLFSLGSVLYAMCTGRPPFRASTTMGILRRVSDDTARPIRELNADIPDWLVAVIDKLHAKTPVERFQSAAEVAELLSRHLAEVQRPSIAPAGIALRAVPRTGRDITGGANYNKRRRWAVAALVLVCLGVGLGLTEATGTTQLTATVIRIFTPSGTLVVETDDSSVNVTIEADGGLSITGAGPQEVRLRPGRYKLRADKGGQPVPLERDLVSITKGGREVVKVKLESPPASVAAQVQKGAFVLLAAGIERKFDTLADAVLSASDGDTIEIRENGPFVTEPIDLGSVRLTIQAGAGLRPIIKLSPAQCRARYLLRTDASLVLEGLEFQRMDQDRPTAELGLTVEELHSRSILDYSTAPLYVANCRFVARQIHACISSSSPVCELRNCELLCTAPEVPGAIVWAAARSGSRLLIRNCLHTDGEIVVGYTAPDAKESCAVALLGNTFVWKHANLRLSFDLDKWQRLPEADRDRDLMRLEASGNVFARESLLLSWYSDKAVPPTEAKPFLKERTRWTGERNLFSLRGPFMGPSVWQEGNDVDSTIAIKTLPEWRDFWHSAETGSVEGDARFHGGNLLQRAPNKLHPEDFRLRSDSPGYRAGKDGKDLGADVDLVGPGPAYERWKKSPEYQEWLKETGQRKESGDRSQGTGETNNANLTPDT